jgi:hypothetical protein
MSRISRRKTIKGLTFAIPALWTAPVVQSVLLPAHAQTSGIEPSECLTSVQVPGCTARCSDADFVELLIFSVDVVDGCLVVQQESSFPDGISHFAYACDKEGDFIDVSLYGYNVNGSQTSPSNEFIEQECSEGCTEAAPFQTVIPFGDIPAQVAFTLSRTCGNDPSLTISDIEVTLV